MMIPKSFFILIATIPIVLAVFFLSKTPEDQTIEVSQGKISLQFIKEDMKRVSFGVTENLGAERREIIFVNEDGDAIYNFEQGGVSDQKRFKFPQDNLTRIRALIMESGFLQIPVDSFIPEKLPDKFIRYTLTVTIDNVTKTIRWIDEGGSEFDPKSAPPLLARIKDLIIYSVKLSAAT